MVYELIVANLNLYAVVKNLEDLVREDPLMREHCAGWDLSIQFSVLGGPKAHIVFENGQCSVVRGYLENPTVKLFFTGPGHLNRMFDGSRSPIPVKGFGKLRFLSKDFTALTDRLEYFLRPTDELLQDPEYLRLNTLFSLTTAAFALPEILLLDPVGRSIGPGIGDGVVLIKVLPDGPAVHIAFSKGKATAHKGGTEAYSAAMLMKDLSVAGAFLNQKLDPFLGIGLGDVMIKGQTPMLDSMGLILDRIPLYLS